LLARRAPPMIDNSQRSPSSRQLDHSRRADAGVDPHLLTAYATSRTTHLPRLARALLAMPLRRAESPPTYRAIVAGVAAAYFRLLEQDESGGHQESMLYRRLRPSARLVPAV